MKNKKLLMGIFLSILLLVSISTSYVYAKVLNTDLIYGNIWVEDHNLGGKSREDAINFLKEKMDISGINIRLYEEGEEYLIGLGEIGFNYNIEEAVDRAFLIGREGNIFERYSEIRGVEKNPRKIGLAYEFNSDQIRNKVDIVEELNSQARDAIIKIENEIIIEAEKVGRKVNIDKLVENINYEVGNWDRRSDLINVKISLEVDIPRYTREYYSQINGIIGEYATSFAGSSWGRINNIRIATNRLNNTVLHPGEVLSYFGKIGPISVAQGYTEAPVIIDGELNPGIGGGVCQPSTTLYNAALLADLTVVERYPHSIAPAYVPRGMDAAIVNANRDLKFKNNLDYPVYVRSFVSGDRVYFRIYGDAKNRAYTVRISSEIVERIPHKVHERLDGNLEAGYRELIQQGRDGYKTVTYRSIVKNGQVVETSIINRDYYRERDYIYLVGPEKKETNKEIKEDLIIPESEQVADPLA